MSCMYRYFQEWLSGRCSTDYGCPTPSVRLLADVVEHQAGGADPMLAQELAKLQFTADTPTTGGGSGRKL